MSDTQASMQPGTLVAVVFVAAIFLAAVILAIRYSRKHESAMRELAQTQGWGFTRGDAGGYAARLEELFPEYSFGVGYAMSVETGARNLVLLDGSYSNRAGRPSSRPAAICLIESSRLRSVGARVEIIGRTWVDEKLLPGQVQMGDTEFARQFIVLSKDPASAKGTVSESLQAMLVAHAIRPLYNPVHIAIGTGKAAVMTGSADEPERWRDLVHLARELEAAVR